MHHPSRQPKPLDLRARRQATAYVTLQLDAAPAPGLDDLLQDKLIARPHPVLVDLDLRACQVQPAVDLRSAADDQHNLEAESMKQHDVVGKGGEEFRLEALARHVDDHRRAAVCRDEGCHLPEGAGDLLQAFARARIVHLRGAAPQAGGCGDERHAVPAREVGSKQGIAPWCSTQATLAKWYGTRRSPSPQDLQHSRGHQGWGRRRSWW